MKTLISFVLGIAAFCAVFYMDSILINFIIKQIPYRAHEWFGLIKIGLWVLALIWTSGIAILIGILVGSIISAILD